MTRVQLPLVISAQEFSLYLQRHHMQKQHDQPEVQVVDLSSESNFYAGHIPGALHLPFQSLVRGQAPAPGKLPDLKQLQNVFQYLGYNESTHYVVCDDEGGGWAGRFIWTLDMIGHENYSYIDGGMLAWRAEGLEVASGEAQAPNSLATSPELILHEHYRAQLPEIVEGLGKDQFLVWDARSPEEYAGTRAGAAKNGHIPGAINAEWTSLMDSNHGYVIRRDAQQYLASLGLDGSLPIITHCQTHHRSGFTYLVGKSLGFEIKAYDGSWSEWGNHPQTPIET